MLNPHWHTSSAAQQPRAWLAFSSDLPPFDRFLTFQAVSFQFVDDSLSLSWQEAAPILHSILLSHMLMALWLCFYRRNERLLGDGVFILNLLSLTCSLNFSLKTNIFCVCFLADRRCCSCGQFGGAEAVLCLKKDRVKTYLEGFEISVFGRKGTTS